MKRYLVLLLLIGQARLSQGREAEVITGLSSCNDCLSEKLFASKSIGPAAGPNLKYNYNNIFIFRGDIAWSNISANDKNNRQSNLRCRNLDFRTEILKAQSGPYRQTDAPYLTEGDIRGNPKIINPVWKGAIALPLIHYFSWFFVLISA